MLKGFKMKQIAGFIASLLLTVGLSAEVREVFVENKGAEIFCRVEGKGSPLIVIHGGPGLSLDCLLPQMSELAKSHLVIFYDQRGCGHSRGEINSETINLEMFVSDLEAIRKVFDLEKVSILGHSWGAFLALQYAFVHPERVQKLVLSNGFPASSEDLGLFIQEYMTRMEPYQETLAKLHAHPGFKEGDPLVIKDLHRTILKTYFYNQEQVDLLNPVGYLFSFKS